MKKILFLIILLHALNLDSNAQSMDNIWEYQDYGSVFCQPYNGSNQPIGWGTGFITLFKDKNYLITNFHNVSDLDANGNLQHSKGKPKSLNVFLHLERLGRYKIVNLELYDKSQKPKYHVININGSLADVVAIEVIMPKECKYKEIIIETPKSLTPGDRLVVIGYPEFPVGLPIPLMSIGKFVNSEEVQLAMQKLTKVPYSFIEPTLVKGFSGSPVYKFDAKSDNLTLQGILALDVNYTSPNGETLNYGGFLTAEIIKKLIEKVNN